MKGSMPAVIVEGLTRSFGGLKAVDHLTFSVDRGELFGLLGPDGAGKTTTLRMLAGVMRPTAGDAAINGTSVVSDPEELKRDIAYMPQSFGLYTDLTVLENIRFYADLYRVPEEDEGPRLRRLLAFSNLGPFQDRPAGDLSGGMKQKLGLCCALIHQPSILILDEPTFGVDPVSRRDLWLIIHEMVGRGATALVSTSYMDEAERFDRVALLHKGRLETVAAPGYLQERLHGEVLIVRCQDARKARRVARALPGVADATLFGETLHLIVDSFEIRGPEIEAALDRSGTQVLEMRRGSPGMEDVFIEFMGKGGQG